MPDRKLLAYWIYGGTVLVLYGLGGAQGWWKNLIRFEGTRWIGSGGSGYGGSGGGGSGWSGGGGFRGGK